MLKTFIFGGAGLCHTKSCLGVISWLYAFGSFQEVRRGPCGSRDRTGVGSMHASKPYTISPTLRLIPCYIW